jgi:flavin-dependent dehydrogenase
VAGASFAGLACARAAAARGLSAAVLERKLDPGQGVRTTGLIVKEAAGLVPSRLTRAIRGVRLYSPSLRSIDLASPGYYFLATDTPAVLRWMAERCGADLFLGRPYPAPIAHEFLVGADGAHSRVAREFGLGINREFLVGVEAEFAGLARGLDPDRLHCFLDSRLAPGYIGWVVPGVGLTQVGLACRQPARPRLDRFIRKISSLFEFGRIVGHRGGLIPVGGPVRPFAAERVLLVGDAAGHVSPLTGGGIHPALEFGRRAGDAIADYLRGTGPHPARLPYPSFFFKRLLRCAYSPWPNRLIDALFAGPLFRAAAQTIFFHHRGLLSGRAWSELIQTALALR